MGKASALIVVEGAVAPLRVKVKGETEDSPYSKHFDLTTNYGIVVS